MTNNQIDLPTSPQALRVWPGVVAVALQGLFWLAPLVVPDAGIVAMLGGLACGLAVLVWWLFFSRAAWVERVGAIAMIVPALIATKRIVHESIAGGAMGMLLYFYAIPVMSLALVIWAVASRRLSLSGGPRRASLVVAILLACGAFTLLRTGGMSGEGDSDFHWRWTPTPEQRLLAQAGNEKEPVLPTLTAAAAPAETPGPTPASGPTTSPTPALAPASSPEKSGADSEGATTGANWSGFRGPRRDGVIQSVGGMRIQTDWSQSKPVEMWRRPVGPGWSSFSVRGNHFYTQEQRGYDEIVSCYNLATGDPVWRHRDKARFYESNAGAGPRATPTLSAGRVYTFGATGILNALNARDGSVIWSRNAASDTKTKVPDWGFASSPLIVGDVVVVAASGVLAAYDAATGNPRWQGPADKGGYSSPQLVTINGVAQILLLNGEGATSVAPADGKLLWKHEWNGDGIVQPFVIAGSDVLLGSGSGMAAVGLRRIAVARSDAGWSVQERWTSNSLKPYYNDFVVHKGHAFGFDGSILACVGLEDGKRKWKGGRYGHGQIILLPDQDLLLALSEEGELALVKATPDQFTELSRFKAIEGKTWNHPVLVGDVLLARNGEEMAAFRLALAGR
ncbi:MAG: PQQ-binding-like beta-propeller repeat protein [Blastocatellales bacterium]